MSEQSKNDAHCFPIFLHKSEWDRLKRQRGPIQLEEPVDSRKEYFDSLNEQSRKWIEHWPNSAEGIKAKLEEERRNRRKENKAFIEAYNKTKKTDNRQELLQKGKQIIFERSCYGRQLISAIVESRTIDEREMQIRVKKEIEQKEAECERNNKHVANPLDFDETATITIRKQATLDCVKFNKEIEKERKSEEAKLKAKEDQCETIDDEIIKQFKEAKAKIKAETKFKEKQEIEEYEAMNKEIKEHRKIAEAYEDALVKAYKKKQDTMRCKIDAVIKQTIEESRSGERAVKIYKVIQDHQNAQQKKYDDFVEKSVKEYDKRNSNQDEKDKKKEEKKRAEQRSIAEENKIAAYNYKLQLQVTAPVNKCVCDVQTLLVKPESEKRRIRALKKSDKRIVNEGEEVSGKGLDTETQNSLSFLRPRQPLLEALQARAKIPSAYSGSKGADQYFAQQATDAIDMCTHKYFAKKVVDDYLKTNCLNLSDLSIPNY